MTISKMKFIIETTVISRVYCVSGHSHIWVMICFTLLGVIFSRRLALTDHVDHLLARVFSAHANKSQNETRSSLCSRPQSFLGCNVFQATIISGLLVLCRPGGISQFWKLSAQFILVYGCHTALSPTVQHSSLYVIRQTTVIQSVYYVTSCWGLKYSYQ